MPITRYNGQCFEILVKNNRIPIISRPIAAMVLITLNKYINVSITDTVNRTILSVGPTFLLIPVFFRWLNIGVYFQFRLSSKLLFAESPIFIDVKIFFTPSKILKILSIRGTLIFVRCTSILFFVHGLVGCIGLYYRR